MFGFSVLTWNSGYHKGTYAASVKKILFGGSSGHTAAELVIPATEENRKLLEEVNTKNKLIVREETTLISRPIDKEPFYEAKEVPCYRIYFSFWGDVKTKKTPEKHRIIDSIRDRIEEGEGIPAKYSAIGKRLFKDDPDKLNTLKWKGKLGSTSGSFGIESIQHLAGLSDDDLSISTEKLEKLEEIENAKELVLWHVKDLAKNLERLKTEEEKQAYLKSKDVQEIFENDEVNSFDELKQKLAGMSAAITQLRYDLVKLQTEFGTSPDDIIHFPIDPEQPLEHRLDYKAILRKMAKFANEKVPYHAVKMNCCTAVMKIILSGVNDELKSKLKKAGYAMPTPNIFFETPQSVYEFSSRLSSVMLQAECPSKKQENHLVKNFLSYLYVFLKKIISLIFKPSKKQQLINLKGEYEYYLAHSKEGLLQLDREFSAGKIKREIFDAMKISGTNLIKSYSQIWCMTV